MMESVQPSAPVLETKQYSRRNIRTNALGAAVYALPETLLLDREDEEDKSGEIIRKTNYLKFLEPEADNSSPVAQKKDLFLAAVYNTKSSNSSMGYCANESPQDVANMMATLSPTANPVPWGMITASPSIPSLTVESIDEDKMHHDAGEEEDHEPIEETMKDAEQSAMDFENESFVTSDLIVGRIRAMVQAHLNESSMDWSMKVWMNHITELFGISSGTSALKQVLKQIIMEEMSPFLSQTQEADCSQIGSEETTHRSSEDATEQPQTQAPDALPVENAIDDENDSSSSFAVKMGSIVNRLISEESVLWSVNIWMAKVAQELDQPELSPDEKALLKDLIYNAAASMMSQTQDSDAMLLDEDLSFLDDSDMDEPAEGRQMRGKSTPNNSEIDFAESSSEEGEDSNELESDADVGAKRKSSKNSKKDSKKRRTDASTVSEEGSRPAKKEEAKTEPMNEELQAIKAIEEGLNARAQAVHELIYRDRDALETKQSELRNKVLERIRNRVNPHLQKISNAAIDSLKSIDSAIDKRSFLKDIVRVFVREDALKAAQSAIEKQTSPATTPTTSNKDSPDLNSGNSPHDFVNLSDEDESSDDEEKVSVVPARPDSAAKTCTLKQEGGTDGGSISFVNGGLRMGTVKVSYGSRNKLKAQLRSRAVDGSCARLASKVGVTSSQDLTDVLAYAEAARKAHAALRADQERADKLRLEQEVLEKEDRRRRYREKLQALDEAESEGEFDDTDEAYVKAVHANGSKKADNEDGENSGGDEDSAELDEEEVMLLQSEGSDSEVEEDVDEDAKIAELQMREEELDRLATAAEKRSKENRFMPDAFAASEDAFQEVPVRVNESEPMSEVDKDESSGDFSNPPVSSNKRVPNARFVDQDSDKEFDQTTAAPRGHETIRDDAIEQGSAVSAVAEEERVQRSRNSKYKKLLMEDAKKKTMPSHLAAFLDEEAEEEEEEGLQRGLLDFGFGKGGDKLDADDELDALRLRKGDLDGIVDDVSDGEGDEEEGARRRMEEERKNDRKLQLKILKNLAEGHMARSNSAQNGRGHFGIDELTKGGIRKSDANDEDVNGMEDDDFLGDADIEDDEELQGKLLSSFTARAKARRDAANREESDIELSDDDESVEDENNNDEENERSMLEREERRLRKERESIMIRSWMEKTRIKCAMQDDTRKKRKSELLAMIGDIDTSLPAGVASSATSSSLVWNGSGASKNSSFSQVLERTGSTTNLKPLSRSHTSIPVASNSAAITARSAVTAPNSQPSVSILAELATLGGMGSPSPSNNGSRMLSRASSMSTASTSSIPGASRGPSPATTAATSTSNPPLTLQAILPSTSVPLTLDKPIVSSSPFDKPVLPASMASVTHHPPVVKKTLKRSFTSITSSTVNRPPSIDTRLPSSQNSDVAAPGSARLTMFGNLTAENNSQQGAPKSSRNGYSGNMSDDAAALCMGMAFADSSLMGAPDSSRHNSRQGFAGESQGGLGPRRLSFFAAAAAATAGGHGAYRPSPTAAVTVAGQGFVFFNDNSSRAGAGESSNTAFFGDGSQGGGDYSSRGGFPSSDTSNNGAPPLKRSKSFQSGPNLSGIVEHPMRRQASSTGLSGIGAPDNGSSGHSSAKRRSLLETIANRGKKRAEKPSSGGR